MQILPTLLFKANAKRFAVEFAAFGRLLNNRAKTCDEQNLYISDCIHSVFY